MGRDLGERPLWRSSERMGMVFRVIVAYPIARILRTCTRSGGRSGGGLRFSFVESNCRVTLPVCESALQPWLPTSPHARFIHTVSRSHALFRISFSLLSIFGARPETYSTPVRERGHSPSTHAMQKPLPRPRAAEAPARPGPDVGPASPLRGGAFSARLRVCRGGKSSPPP